jgi:hypothetical protein
MCSSLLSVHGYGIYISHHALVIGTIGRDNLIHPVPHVDVFVVLVEIASPAFLDNLDHTLRHDT